MRSSTSNSDQSRWYWLLVLVIGLTLSAALILSAEQYWRGKGHRPGIVDSEGLWSLQRSKVYDDRPLVFLGASRTLFGVDLDETMRMLSELESGRYAHSSAVMLALNGRYPVAALQDLAEDEGFVGTVMVDVDARGLSRYNWDAQASHVDYFRSDWSPNWWVHRLLLNPLQSFLVTLDPRFSLVTVGLNRWTGGPMPVPSHARIDARRMGYLNFRGADGELLGDWFAEMLEDDLRRNPPPQPDSWLESAKVIAAAAKRIEARGGRVIFWVPPVSGKQRQLAEAAYPRALYWQRFVDHYDLNGLHYEDVPGLLRMNLPDESHVGLRQKIYLTRALVRALVNRSLLPVDEKH